MSCDLSEAFRVTIFEIGNNMHGRMISCQIAHTRFWIDSGMDRRFRFDMGDAKGAALARAHVDHLANDLVLDVIASPSHDVTNLGFSSVSVMWHKSSH